MALSPTTERALTRAIKMLHSEVGEVPEYKGLLDSMKQAVGSGDGGDEFSQRDHPERDGEKDDYSFDTAQRRHKERTQASADASEGAGKDGAGADAEGGEDK